MEILPRTVGVYVISSIFKICYICSLFLFQPLYVLRFSLITRTLALEFVHLPTSSTEPAVGLAAFVGTS